ncbi:hypothetical protein [Tsuneonella sp. HG222]
MNQADDELLLIDGDAAPSGDRKRGDPAPPEIVPAAESIWIALPRRPDSQSELARMIEERVPLSLNLLVWTDAVVGAEGELGSSVCRKSLLEPALDSGGAIDERTGLPFHGLPVEAARRAIVTSTWVAASLAVALLSVVTKPEPSTEATLSATVPASATLDEGLLQTPVIAAIALAGRTAERGYQITTVGAKGDGGVQLEIAATDPDAARAQATTDPDLARFAQISQVRGDDGKYRISLAGAPVLAGNEKVAVTPVIANSPFAAQERIRTYLSNLAEQYAVRVTLDSSRPLAARPLEFAISLEGPEAAVLSVAEKIETGTPPIAISEWKVSSADGGAAFSASLVVPWIEKQ